MTDKIQDRLSEMRQRVMGKDYDTVDEARTHIDGLEFKMEMLGHAGKHYRQQRDELAATLRKCLDNMKAAHARFNTDCCMCGSDISGQAHCDNHMPTDSGEYYAHQAIKAGEEALAKMDAHTSDKDQGGDA